MWRESPLNDIARDRFGRPLIKPPGADKATPYRRASSYGDILDDKYHLNRWFQRNVADGIARNRDLQLRTVAAAGDKRALDAVVDAALERQGTSNRAEVGTAIHALTEQWDFGIDDLAALPEEYQRDIQAYDAATRDYDVLSSETFVVCDELKAAGTFDRLLWHDGHAYIADIKTGSSVDYPHSFAVQLAIYAHGLRYDPSTASRTPLYRADVDVDKALIIWLPAGEGHCELKWIDIAAGWQAAQLAQQVYAWRGNRKLTWKVEDAA